MSKTFNEVWFDVQGELDEAKGIAFDGCHKIYILKDNGQVHEMAGYGYGSDGDGSHLITSMSMTPAEMLTTIKKWYEDSCALRFVQSVETVKEGEDPNLGFDSIIPQGYESEFCTSCGEFGTDFDGLCDECREEDEEDECERCGTRVGVGELDGDSYCEDCAEEDEDEDE